MNLSLYLTIQQIIMGYIMALGVRLIFIDMPKELKGSRVESYGRIMGVAAITIPIASFIYYFSNMRDAGVQFATAINLSAYCISTTLMATACYVLMDLVRYKLIMKIHIIIGLLYHIPLWIGLYSKNELIARHTLIILYTLYCALSVIRIATCIYFYHQKRANLDRSEMVTPEFKLLSRTIYLCCGLFVVSMLSTPFFSYPLWLAAIFSIIFIGGVIYLDICYHKLLSNHICTSILQHQPPIDLTIEEIVEPSKSELIGFNDELKANIEKNLRVWIARKGFQRSNISINLLAKEVCTNRTYLSKYINSTYSCSFRSWITQLRIEEAKELLRNHTELSVVDIAKQIGFASAESFSHTFTRYEQLSPSKWKEICEEEELEPPISIV